MSFIILPPRASALGDNVGSAGEIAEPTLRDPQEQAGPSVETMTVQVDANEARGQSPNPSATGQLELILATFVFAMQRDSALLKESIRADVSIRRA
jgi:hypothetical protein